MGILDDAIREHLELKRSHGASEDELSRKEAEAFGPVRQDAAPAEPAEPAIEEHTQLLSTDDAPVAAPEDPFVVHPGDDLVPDEDAPPVAPHHEHEEQHPALLDHDHIGGEEHPPEPVFRASAEAPVAPPPDAPLEPAPVDDPPVGDPPIDEPIERAEPGAEDPLEETPEFLQDAPEHDRLWFEQKPPRDFDFGE